MFFVASLSPRYGPLRPAPKHLFFLFFSFLFFSFLPSPSSWVTGCYRAIRFHFGWLNRVVLSSSLPLSDTKAVLQCCQAARPLQDSKPGPQLVAARKVLVSSGGHLVCNGYQWFSAEVVAVAQNAYSGTNWFEDCSDETTLATSNCI